VGVTQWFVTKLNSRWIQGQEQQRC
jgi:hypothetical protein